LRYDKKIINHRMRARAIFHGTIRLSKKSFSQMQERFFKNMKLLPEKHNTVDVFGGEDIFLICAF